MNLNGKKILLHDMCLRDGMHPKQHQITLAQMQSISAALDEAGVPLIEVTHGDGLGGASVNYGFSAESDETYLRGVVETAEVSTCFFIEPRVLWVLTHLGQKRQISVKQKPNDSAIN